MKTQILLLIILSFALSCNSQEEKDMKHKGIIFKNWVLDIDDLRTIEDENKQEDEKGQDNEYQYQIEHAKLNSSLNRFIKMEFFKYIYYLYFKSNQELDLNSYFDTFLYDYFSIYYLIISNKPINNH